MNPKKIAILGDIHGHVTLALGLLRRWELESKKTLDLILQVGDFGVFPQGRDAATRRFAKNDPDELGFLQYLSASRESDLLLNPESSHKISAPILFVKGNHEDFAWLAHLQRGSSAVSIDHFGRIMYLPNGCIYKVLDGPINWRNKGNCQRTAIRNI